MISDTVVIIYGIEIHMGLFNSTSLISVCFLLVHEPGLIRGQMDFSYYTMMKMFLGAAGSGADTFLYFLNLLSCDLGLLVNPSASLGHSIIIFHTMYALSVVFRPL